MVRMELRLRHVARELVAPRNPFLVTVSNCIGDGVGLLFETSHCQEEETYTSTLLELTSAAAVETEVPFDDIRVVLA